MTAIDIIILIGLLLYMILGFRDGLLKKVFGILSFWGGLIIATKLMVPVGDLFTEWIGFSHEVSLIFAFGFLFLVISVGVNFAYRKFGSSDSESLKIFSRICGVILGACQGMLAMSLLLIMFSLFDIPSKETKEESLFYDQTYQFAPTIFNYTTQWIPGSKNFMDELKSKIEPFQIKK